MRPDGYEAWLGAFAPKLLDYPHFEEGFFVDPGTRGVDEAYAALVAALDRAIPRYALRRDTCVADLYFAPSPAGRPDLRIDTARLRASLAGMEGEFPPDTAWLIFNLEAEAADAPGFERIVVAEFAGALTSRSADGLSLTAITRHVEQSLDIHPLFSVEKHRVRLFLTPPVTRNGTLGGDVISACVDRILRVGTVGAPAEDLCRQGLLPSRLICELERTLETDPVRYAEVRRALLGQVEAEFSVTPKRERKAVMVARWLHAQTVTHARS
jgi:hypothetical protein